jgi:hypothetical protein
MLRKLTLVLATAAMLATAGRASAQGTGPNGGMLGGTGSHKVELVVGPSELTVYMTENGKTHDAKGVSLRAVIQQAGKTTTINFADQGGKKLVARLEAPLAQGAVVVVSGKDDHGDSVQARYVIK